MLNWNAFRLACSYSLSQFLSIHNGRVQESNVNNVELNRRWGLLSPRPPRMEETFLWVNAGLL